MNPASQGASLTEGKRSKRSKKTGENGDTINSVTEGEGSTVTDDTIDGVKSNVNGDEGEDDAEWTVDVSEEAVRSRLLDLTDGAKNMTISEDVDKTEKERFDIFYEECKKRRDAGELDNVQTHKDLAIEASRLEVQHKAPLALAELLFTANIVQEVRKYRNLLLRFTHNDIKAQKYLIGGLEQIIALHSDKLMDKVAGIFKLFYDNDILEEKVILEWASKVSKKYVSKEIAAQIHEKAKPFVQWLQEAEEEESDEESDDDVEIEYNDRAKIEPLKKEPMQKKEAPKSVEEDDGDDLNIDDI